MPEYSYATVDVFTTRRLAGNQLAVVDVPAGTPLATDRAQMGQIAREFNYSESVFLHQSRLPVTEDSEHGSWDINIFLTTGEIPWAGHPTIGTAWLLADRYPQLKTATLHALAGPIDIVYKRDAAGVVVAAANVPHSVHRHAHDLPAEALLLGQPALRGKLMWPTQPVVSVVKGVTFSYVQLNSRARLSEVCTTSHASSPPLDEGWTPSFHGSYFFHQAAAHGNRLELHTRMIEGPLEDAATGSAASGLAAHLTAERWRAGSRDPHVFFEIHQGEDMGRPSTIYIRTTVDQAGALQTIELSGSAVQVMQGRIIL